mmetsp:Transcript_152110/g.291286  ORF Transcript_152110/g.291286 Transcript_152110/m.291286 type:complete len:240 (+) Transcript_152110:85-804(+)
MSAAMALGFNAARWDSTIRKATFNRYDPQREAQEMLAEMRPLVPPAPRSRVAASETAGTTHVAATSREAEPAFASADIVRSDAGSAESEADPFTAVAETPRDHPAMVMRHPRNDSTNFRHLSNRRALGKLGRGGSRSARSAGPGTGAQTRAAAELQLRRARLQQQQQQVEPAYDHRRKNVLLNEQRMCQGRWPPEARWAGHPPDFMKERFDRLGTLANERGDGRKLPHERPEKWFWNDI